MTSMEKKFPMIHSNIKARRRRTGPVKKKMPLLKKVSEMFALAIHKNLRDTSECCRSTPPHHDSCISQGRYDKAGKRVSIENKRRTQVFIPHEPQWSRIGKTLSEVSCGLSLGRKVQLHLVNYCSIVACLTPKRSSVTFSNSSGEIVIPPEVLTWDRLDPSPRPSGYCSFT